jgi:hypothetical protein
VKDVAYVFSVAPYIATKKHFGYGPTVHVAAREPGQRYSVTPVPKATCYKDFGDEQRETFPVDPMDMIGDIVRECTTLHGKMGVWGSEDPVPTEESILKAEAEQRVFYGACIKDADGLWARFQDPAKIPFHALVGARELNVVRDWAKDIASLTPCLGCRELVSPDAAKCGKCGAILDWDKAQALGLVTEEEVRFATKRKLIKSDPKAEAA